MIRFHPATNLPGKLYTILQVGLTYGNYLMKGVCIGYNKTRIAVSIGSGGINFIGTVCVLDTQE